MPWVKNPNFKLDTYYQSFDFLFLLKEHFEIRVYDRIGINYVFEKDDVVFNYDKTSSKSKLIIPSGLIAMIRAWNPDIVYLQGLGFPHYLIWLKYNLKPSTKFVVRDHADRLPKRCYKWLYKLANKHVNTYVFTSKEMANPWINNGFITSNKEIKSCVEGSTRFTYNEKIKKEKNSFLWVGRLDENKDPLTILKAFKE